MTAGSASRSHTINYVAEPPADAPKLGPHLRQRLAKRSLKPSTLGIGTVKGRTGWALFLMDGEGQVKDVEMHARLDLVMGQAEFEFGVPPGAWRRNENLNPTA
ncbi:MAG: hypothetical protein ACKVQT_37335 [Burkholderiales bacterium]